MSQEQASSVRLVVGLGNPGVKYAQTRHNIGFMVLEEFCRRHGWDLREEKKFLAFSARGRWKGESLHLLLPTTYMNESGRAVRKALDFFKLDPSQVLVVCDDIALSFGEMRIREKGSSGGQNGLKNIQQHLGTQAYLRLRMGIGKERQSQSLSSHVLGKFTSQEMTKLERYVKSAVDVVEKLLSDTPDRVMNQVNRKIQKKSSLLPPRGKGNNQQDPEQPDQESN